MIDYFIFLVIWRSHVKLTRSKTASVKVVLVGMSILCRVRKLGHITCGYNQKVHITLKVFIFFSGCPVDPGRRGAADGKYSHIITPREVTRGFRGGSLSSRNILQLNGKLILIHVGLNTVCVDTLTCHLNPLSLMLCPTQLLVYV